MYIQRNKQTGKNGKEYTGVFLCRKYRQDNKIKTEVISNFSKLPVELVVSIENILKHSMGALVTASEIVVQKVIDYGLVFLIIHLMRKLHIDSTLDKAIPQYSPIIKTMIIGKIVTRGSKLGIYNWIMRNQIIADKIGINTHNLKVDDLYAALSVASSSQEQIERKWFSHHGKNKQNDIFLYDITSTYFEGTQNELAAFGYNRDKKKGKMQINIGLITNGEGFPLKIEVFRGNLNDHKTVLQQISHLKDKLQARNLIFVGDRGMKIKYNLDTLKEAEREGIDYITGLTHQEIDDLVSSRVIDLNLFTKELAEIEYEGLRYILSENPELKAEEVAYLEKLKLRMDVEISKIEASWEKRRLKNLENITKLEQGDKNKKLVTRFSEKSIDKYKKSVLKVLLEKHATKYYQITEISDQRFEITFDQAIYEHAMQMAGKYAVSTTVKTSAMNTNEVRETYKNLQSVEHAFRDFKSDNVQVRPVYHRNEAQTRGHVLISMFSYAIIKEMETKMFPFLKIWNRENNQKLSFNDLQTELESIKYCSLNLGNGMKKINITELNEIQTQILNMFGMKKSDIEATL